MDEMVHTFEYHMYFEQRAECKQLKGSWNQTDSLAKAIVWKQAVSFICNSSGLGDENQIFNAPL